MCFQLISLSKESTFLIWWVFLYLIFNLISLWFSIAHSYTNSLALVPRPKKLDDGIFPSRQDKSIGKQIKSPSRNGIYKIARLSDNRSYIVVPRAASISRRNCSMLFSSGPLTFRKNGKQLPRSDMCPVRLAFFGGRDGGNKGDISLTRQSARFNDRDETRAIVTARRNLRGFSSTTSTTMR